MYNLISIINKDKTKSSIILKYKDFKESFKYLINNGLNVNCVKFKKYEDAFNAKYEQDFKSNTGKDKFDINFITLLLISAFPDNKNYIYADELFGYYLTDRNVNELIDDASSSGALISREVVSDDTSEFRKMGYQSMLVLLTININLLKSFDVNQFFINQNHFGENQFPLFEMKTIDDGATLFIRSDYDGYLIEKKIPSICKETGEMSYDFKHKEVLCILAGL